MDPEREQAARGKEQKEEEKTWKRTEQYRSMLH